MEACQVGHTLSAVLTLASAVAAPVPPPDAKKDAAALQGEWVAVPIEQKGAALPADCVKLQILTLTVEGERFKFSNFLGKERSGKYRLDPAAKPKAIDLDRDPVAKESSRPCWASTSWAGTRCG
jgi:uncharacterized protein (TIGR03067 family)